MDDSTRNGQCCGIRAVPVMDVWEHELLLDYPPAQRAKYIETFFANIDWQAVEGRLQTGY